jgi:nitrogen fixation NifU-like protein
MPYSSKVVDRFEDVLKNPEAFSVGRFDPKDKNVGTGMVGAPACGDVMRLQIKCRPQNNTYIIEDVKFKTYGCGSAIASSSELIEMLIGKTLEEAKEIKNRDIANALSLPSIKIHCSVLAEDSIRRAIDDFESKLL